MLSKKHEGDFPEVAVMRIHNLVPTATIDFTTGAVTKDMFGEPTTITCRRVDEATFEAIVVPQRITSRLPFIEMEASGISYLIEDTFHFKPGRMYTYTLIINSNPDQIECRNRRRSRGRLVMACVTDTKNGSDAPIFFVAFFLALFPHRN